MNYTNEQILEMKQQCVSFDGSQMDNDNWF